MEYTVKQLAGLAGVSPRTIRHYDEIGLLKPCHINASGYRIYGKEQVDLLQQILFFRELEVGLPEIMEILQSPDYDQEALLQRHLSELEQRAIRLERLIATVRKTILVQKGMETMTDQEKFEGFKQEMIRQNEAAYGEEIRTKYGEEAIDKSNEKVMKLNKAEMQKMEEMGKNIQAALQQAVRNGAHPGEAEGQRIAAMHRQWLEFTWPDYSREAHAGLGQMYVTDDRFKRYYDEKESGCAQFLCDAIAIYTGTSI